MFWIILNSRSGPPLILQLLILLLSSPCICISDLPQSEPNTHIPNEAGPAPPTVLPHPINVLGVLRYPVGTMGPRGPSVAVQPASFAIPTQIPVHLHPPGPTLQMHTMAVQGLPPPPPPPPPVQQGSLTVLSTDPLPQVRDWLIVFWASEMLFIFFNVLVLYWNDIGVISLTRWLQVGPEKVWWKRHPTRLQCLRLILPTRPA